MGAFVKSVSVRFTIYGIPINAFLEITEVEACLHSATHSFGVAIKEALKDPGLCIVSTFENTPGGG